MKTKEELNTLKEEVESVNKKLSEVCEDELKQVTGGGCPRPNVNYIVPTLTTKIDSN